MKKATIGFLTALSVCMVLSGCTSTAQNGSAIEETETILVEEKEPEVVEKVEEVKEETIIEEPVKEEEKKETSESVDVASLEPLESDFTIDKNGMKTSPDNFVMDLTDTDKGREYMNKIEELGGQCLYAGGYYIGIGDYLLIVTDGAMMKDAGLDTPTSVAGYRRWPSDESVMGELQPFDFNEYVPEYEEEIYAILDWFIDYAKDKPVTMPPLN